MTHQPDIARRAHRRAIAVFLAVAFPSTVLAQETVTPPTVPAPTQQAPAPAPAPTGESRTRIAPGVLEQAEQEAQERAAARRAERAEARPQRPARPVRAVERPEASQRAEAPAPQAVPEPAAPVAPAATAPEAATPPAEVAPAPVEVPATTTTEPAETAPAPVNGGSTPWLVLAALGLAAAAVAGLLLLRRRPRDEDAAYETYRTEAEPVAAAPEHIAPAARHDPVREAPAAPAPRAADPVAAAPLFVTKPEAIVLNETARKPASKPARQAGEAQPALENAELVTPDSADIDAVLGGAKQHGGRPQLELAIRPTQAGMSSRGATVAFELTVANAGDTPAEDVRIGAFMLGDNAAAPSEIERLLTNPPANHVVPAERIEPGDGKQLNASVTLPREQVDAVAGAGDDGFTPVLVADARYRLPDGSEGRTAAAFTIGRVNGGAQLVPIALQDDPAIYADVEARLHSVPAKV